MNQQYNLQKINWKIPPIINYRGCLVEKFTGGFLILGIPVTSMEQVDKIIDNSLQTISNSLKK